MFDEYKRGAPLPQVLILSPVLPFETVDQKWIELINEASGGCYEVAARTQFHISALHRYGYRTTLRMIPYKRCRARLIKKGYYRGNKSLGLQADFERAFEGFAGSPLKQRVDQIKKENPQLFKN